MNIFNPEDICDGWAASGFALHYMIINSLASFVVFWPI